MLTRYILQIIGSLVFMFILNATLTGILLGVVPVVSLSAVRYGKTQRKAHGESFLYLLLHTAAAPRLNRIWQCSTISFASKFKLYKSLVTSNVLCSCETWAWTLLADSERKGSRHSKPNA